MSVAACVKKILCDPDASQLEAIVNVFEFLDAQSYNLYGGDPSEVLDLKEILYESISPQVGEAFKNILNNVNSVTTS